MRLSIEEMGKVISDFVGERVVYQDKDGIKFIIRPEAGPSSENIIKDTT